MTKRYPTPSLKVIQYTASTPAETLKKTVELIGSAIKDGANYLPIRSHAAGLASRAGPKDYLGQVAAIFNDFVKRWRYVHDPIARETITTTGPAIYSQTLGASAKPGERGYGDCDDATTAIGSMLAAIGLPVRIKTIAGPKAKQNQIFTHVYPEVRIPKTGWVSVDAVGHPRHGLGWTPPAKREATWTTSGRLVSARGEFPRALKNVLKNMVPKTATIQGFGSTQEVIEMNTAQNWPDYGLDRFGLAGDVNDGQELEDFSKVGILEFGAYADRMGIINGDRLGILMEYDDDDGPDDSDLVRTKMLEMAPEDIEHTRLYGYPRLGSVALADDGDYYQYISDPQLGGWFKKLRKRVKRKAKKLWKKGKKFAKKIIKKLPGGKYLLKFHAKLHKIAMKIAKPLMKYVGKYAKKLAPIAAMIPGYGPAIAGALYSAGKITDVLKKFGVGVDKKGKPKFKSGKQAKQFKRALVKQAKRAKKRGWDKKMKRKVSKSRRRAQVGRRRLIKRGTSAHRAVLRGVGIDLYDDE